MGGGRGGDAYYQNSYNPQRTMAPPTSTCVMPSRGMLSMSFQLGRGKLLSLSNNLLLDELLGGWQLSGTMVLSTGNPLL